MVSPNMLPALLEGELLVARAWAWRSRENGEEGVKRGDIVMHRQNGGYFIRRVVALPGERFSVSKGVAAINGVPFKSELVGVMKVKVSESVLTDGTIFWETTPEGRSYQIVVRQLPEGRDEGPSPILTVPDGYVAVLSDNRIPRIAEDYGKIGFVSFANLIARPLAIITSADSTRVGQAIR